LNCRQRIRLLESGEKAPDPPPEGFHEDDDEWQYQKQKQEDERNRNGQPSDQLLLGHDTPLR
jgi:hypothetical protein